MDTYGEGRIKEMTQRCRAANTRKVVIGGPDQAMPKPRDWASFLSDGDNKTELIRFISEYCKSDKVRRKLKVPLTITAEDKTYLIESTGVQELSTCNHHEADTRIILHAVNTSDPVIVIASDTDILILLVFTFRKITERKIQMKIDNQRFVDINNVCSYLTQEICEVLPSYHSLTGCDTTSYPFGVCKVKPFKKAIKEGKFGLLKDFGSGEQMDLAEKFICIIMYPARENETSVQVRMKMYEKQKQKSSSNLIPDSSSLKEHIRRANLQAYIWHQCVNQNIDYPDQTKHGWKIDEGGHLAPLWFNGPVLPPSLIKIKRKRKTVKSLGYDADTETLDEGRKKKKQRRRIIQETGI